MQHLITTISRLNFTSRNDNNSKNSVFPLFQGLSAEMAEFLA